MNSYYDRIKEVLPDITESDLKVPVREGVIDSIDLLCIRTILEKRVGELPDKLWNQFKTVQSAIDYCSQREHEAGAAPEGLQPLTWQRAYQIGMPQMTNGCLSEHWLFMEGGDLHWALLFAGLDTCSGNLKDDTGARLYATFVRIQMVHDALSSFHENERLQLEGTLRRFGGGTYISTLEGTCAGKGIDIQLMTTFSVRVDVDNAKLLKSVPLVRQNTIPEYGTTPSFLSDYRMIRKGLLDRFEVAGISFEMTRDVVFETEYDINPYYEINGVGLLYFASYPVISDVCEARYFNREGEKGLRWEVRYSTAIRDIFYFANCNRDDTVVYQLNSYDLIDRERIRLCSSLWRKSDGMLMARLFTVKVVMRP